MKIITVLFLILFVSLPAHAQEAGCDAADLAGSYGELIGAATTLDDLQARVNEFSLVLAACSAAPEDRGLLRSSPAPAGARVDTADYSLTVSTYADITTSLGDRFEPAEGNRILEARFDYHCNLPVDEICAGNLNLMRAVGASGTIYEDVLISGIGLDSSWEVFGGGTVENLRVIFAVKAEDVDGLIFMSQAGRSHDELRRFHAAEFLGERSAAAE